MVIFLNHEEQEKMKRYIGVDLHTNSITVCYFERDDNMSFESYKLTAEGLACFKQSLKLTDELAVEATGNTDYFVNEIESLVSRVVVVNPRQFGVIRKSVSKTDKNDARSIAYFLSKDMLPSCRRKSSLENMMQVSHRRGIS
jgi:transposase